MAWIESVTNTTALLLNVTTVNAANFALFGSNENSVPVTEDPLGFDGGDVNFYAYVRNDPINLIDRFGLRPSDKYPISSARCAGWTAEIEYNPWSRHRTRAES